MSRDQGNIEQKLKTVEHYSYYLSDSIGKGFSSTVYKGRNKNNNEIVAIKVIDLRKLSESTMRQLLQSQIGIIKTLKHNNVLKCENVFITVNNCYIVTELCEGGDLASEIKKKGRLRGVEALRIMVQIARAVQHLASLNIIHRDIKPANILLHNNIVKIADFGFAKYQEQGGKKQKYSVGSPLYMSPEALFQNFYSKQNDIWSLGVVFYQILQGRPPWDPKNQRQLKDILKEKKQVFFRIAVRDQLQTIIRGCLKHQRNERMSIQSILTILQQMLKQMLSQENTAYRETLTKRNLNTLSCKDLNQTNSTSGSNTSRPPLMPKIPKPPTSTALPPTQTTILKQNTKKQEKICLSTQQPMIMRNRSAIQLKQKTPAAIIQPVVQNPPLEEASRHNHWILKSIINYSRLVYKNFARLDKLQVKQPLRLEIQSNIVDLLHYSTNWLKDSVTISKEAEKFGIINFDKFKQTRCYSKTILVINEYFERYTKFVTKTRRFINNATHKPSSPNSQLTLHCCISKLRKSLQSLYIHSWKIQHNICVDFLISIVLLSQMIETHSTAHFAEFSHVQQIVETEPLPITEEQQIKELMEKLEAITTTG